MKSNFLSATLPLLGLVAFASSLHAQYVHVSAVAQAETNTNYTSSQFEYSSDQGYTEAADPTDGFVGTPASKALGLTSFYNYCGMRTGVNPISNETYGSNVTAYASLASGKIGTISGTNHLSTANSYAEMDDTLTFVNSRVEPVLLHVLIRLHGSLGRGGGNDDSSRCKLGGTFIFQRTDGPYTQDGAAYGNRGNFMINNDIDGLRQTNDFETGTGSPVEVSLPSNSAGGSVAINVTLYPGTSTFAVSGLISMAASVQTTVAFGHTAGFDFDMPEGVTYTSASGLFLTAHPDFFAGEVPLTSGVYYLTLPNGNAFGYYSYLADKHYIYHQDLGYEYVFDADDDNGGVYLYDFKSGSFFYTSPAFPFPYLYDFTLNTVLYYYPDPNNPGRYNTNGVRYFYDFATGKIISK